jgi:hypothetical protein
MGDELDETRAFLGGLAPPAKPEASPPAKSRQQIDDGAAHLAATLTELKVSTQRLHADLAQRMRAIEAKVDAGLPDWKLLGQAVVRAGEEAGRKATADLVTSNRALMAEGQALNDRRAQDLAFIWTMVNWVLLPILALAAGAICWLAWKFDRLGFGWTLAVAIGLGALLAVLAGNLWDWGREKLRERAVRRGRR